MTAIKYVWCLFVGWLMRATFSLDVVGVMKERRELVAARLKIDALKITLEETRAERTSAINYGMARGKRAGQYAEMAKRYRAALDDIAIAKTHTRATLAAKRALRTDPPTLRSFPAAPKS